MLVVLTSGRGRLNGTAFAIGFVAGQSTVCLLALTIGSWSPLAHTGNHETLQGGLEIAFGIALLVAPAYFRRHRDQPPSPRARAVRARLSTLRPITALGTGAALGIGGPKRLGVTLVVTASIASADIHEVQAVALATIYVVIGTALVWLPVLLYIVFGARGAEWLTDGQTWIAAHKDPLTFYPSAVLGLVLVVDGLVQLRA